MKIIIESFKTVFNRHPAIFIFVSGAYCQVGIESLFRGWIIPALALLTTSVVIFWKALDILKGKKIGG